MLTLSPSAPLGALFRARSKKKRKRRTRVRASDASFAHSSAAPACVGGGDAK
jgi:hypothetical protein